MRKYLLLFLLLCAGVVSFAAYGINWDSYIDDYLQDLNKKTGIVIVATPKSTISLNGLQVRGIVAKAKDINIVFRDVTFGINLLNIINGKTIFDNVYVARVELIKAKKIIYSQDNLSFAITANSNQPLTLYGSGIVLQVKPQNTTVELTLAMKKWFIALNIASNGDMVFYQPPQGFNGISGKLSLQQGSIIGDIELFFNDLSGDGIGFLSKIALENFISSNVDITIRSQQINRFKNVIFRLKKQQSIDNISINTTASDKLLGNINAKINVAFNDGVDITIMDLHLGNINAVGSWKINVLQDKYQHNIRLKLSNIALGFNNEMQNIFGGLKKLNDDYKLFITTDNMKMGSLIIEGFEYKGLTTKNATQIDSLRFKSSLNGQVLFSGKILYETNTPYLNMNMQTDGTFFSDLSAVFPNLPTFISHLNGVMQTDIVGYAHYPKITIKHRDSTDSISTFQGQVETFTAPIRFNGNFSYQSPDGSQLTSTISRRPEVLVLSKIQGKIAEYPFSGQGFVDLNAQPVLLKGNFNIPQIKMQALEGNKALDKASIATCQTGNFLPIPFATSAPKYFAAQINILVDKLIFSDTFMLTNVSQKWQISPAGVRLKGNGRYGTGNMVIDMTTNPNQGMPAVEMKLRGDNIALGQWGGKSSFTVNSASFGACLYDHLNTINGQLTFQGYDLRPPSNILNIVQKTASGLLGSSSDPKGFNMQSVTIDSDIQNGVMNINQAKIILPLASINISGQIQPVSKKIDIMADIASNTQKPLKLTMQGTTDQPTIKVNNQTMWEYMLNRATGGK